MILKRNTEPQNFSQNSPKIQKYLGIIYLLSITVLNDLENLFYIGLTHSSEVRGAREGKCETYTHNTVSVFPTEATKKFAECVSPIQEPLLCA